MCEREIIKVWMPEFIYFFFWIEQIFSAWVKQNQQGLIINLRIVLTDGRKVGMTSSKEILGVLIEHRGKNMMTIGDLLETTDRIFATIIEIKEIAALTMTWICHKWDKSIKEWFIFKILNPIWWVEYWTRMKCPGLLTDRSVLLTQGKLRSSCND